MSEKEIIKVESTTQKIDVKEFVSKQKISELEGLTFYEIEKVNDKVPSLSMYSLKSLKELSTCIINFSSSTSPKTGETTYNAVVRIKPGFEVKFRSNSFKPYKYGDLDEIGYNRAFLSASSKANGRLIREHFTINKAYYRLDFGYSKDDNLYAKISIIAGSIKQANGELTLVILSQFVPVARIKDLRFNHDWTSSDNPIRPIYLGKTNEEVIIEDEDIDSI